MLYYLHQLLPFGRDLGNHFHRFHLKNFRDGIRGAHPDDFYGRQMAQISMMLNEDQEINDLIAYMNTLQVQQVADTGDSGNYK